MSNIDYTLWPTNGQLGSTNITIPTNAEDWPAGDALVGNFVYNKGHLVGFVDTKALVANESKSTTFPYDYVNITVDKSLEGVMTFNGCAKPEYLIITYTESGNSGDTIVLGTKYLGCKNLVEIEALDPNYKLNDIVDGVWTQSLEDLQDATQDGGTSIPSVFENCPNLVHFNSNLRSLTNGCEMFYNCSAISSFDADLSSLTNGYYMFKICRKLSSFNCNNLDCLIEGNEMFYHCENLTSFSCALPSLKRGGGMFEGCKLDTHSVQNIAATINSELDSTEWHAIHIGIGNSTPNAEETTAFNTIASKGWAVYVDVNGIYSSLWNPTSLTPIDGEEQQTPIPYWAKPINSDEQHARYIDSEGNFYNILGGNFIYGDNLETYGMFTSKEDAAAQMRLTKIEKK